MSGQEKQLKPPRVCVVEDDESLQQVYRQLIEQAGYDFQGVYTLEEARRKLAGNAFDLIILDWTLPDGSGDSLIKECREQLRLNVPIIIVTGLDEDTNIANALLMGADDYIVKPFQKQVFMARCAAVLRRANLPAEPQRGPQDNYSPYSFDEPNQQVSLRGQPISLTGKEYQLALQLFSHSGSILSRRELLESVWGVANDIDTRTVDAHIGKLRRKMQ
ncbi:MAG: response regulator transcription factor, partial [Gammaproteobacteria bacterium]